MSLILDGYEAQRDLQGVYLSIARGRGRHETPPARSASSLLPFRAGRRPDAALHDARVLELVGWITLPVANDLVNEVDTLKAILDPGRPPWILRDTLPDGSVRWINVVGRNVVWNYLNPHTYRLSAELTADDPFWYGTWGTLALDSGLFLNDGLTLDSSAEVVIAGSGVASLDTLGTADVDRVRVRFVGPSTGPVGLATGGAQPIGFTVARTLIAGETLEVDNDARTALLAGLSLRNAMTLSAGNRHGEYIRLPAGSVTLHATGGAAEVRISFNPTYL